MSLNTKRIIVGALAFLFFLTVGSTCFALDADDIKALDKKPHSRKNLVPELKIYPEAREYGGG